MVKKMNLGLRCGQMMAERNRGMNIIERSAFWCRYERNSHREDKPIEKPPIVQPEFVAKQWDIVNQLRLDQQNLRKTLYDTLKKKDYVNKETYGYK